ncbi:Preprotein translocase subunit SECE1, partial [Linum perenne]
LKLSWKPPPHPHHQSPIKLQSPSFPLKFKPLSIHSNSSFISRLPQSRNGGFVRRAVEESQEQTVSEQLSESKAKPEVRPSDTPREQGGEQEINDLGAEIRKAMMEKKKEEKAGLMREVREIEWPFFGRVLGTTGVVLGVIAGSSVVFCCYIRDTITIVQVSPFFVVIVGTILSYLDWLYTSILPCSLISI